MVKVKLLDNEWMENIINRLLIEGLTDLDKKVCQEKGYRELEEKIGAIEAMAAGTPAADVMDEYRSNLELMSGYEYNAAYLNGLKAGFNLASFFMPDPEQLQAEGKRDSRHTDKPLITA
ncbi:hypothetical protein AALB47_23075 [Lachnospiraceae bacterium 54-11]